MKIRRPVNQALAVLAMLGAAFPLVARGSTATATIAVSANVTTSCTLGASSLPFGNYTAAVNNTTTVVVATCTLGTPYNVGLDAGLGVGATVTLRKMTLGGGTLNYALYSDSAHSLIWGTTIGTNTVVGTGNGLPQAINVYGQIPGSQNVAPGSYTDTVTATITY